VQAVHSVHRLTPTNGRMLAAIQLATHFARTAQSRTRR
jgi:hypothetical protein